MTMQQRQDIQRISIKAEQLAGLAQTLFEFHPKFDHFQLKTICALVYDLSSEIHDWTEREETAQAFEENKRHG